MRAGSQVVALALGLSVLLDARSAVAGRRAGRGPGAPTRTGRLAEAEEALRIAVEARPESAEAHYYLGLAHLRQAENALAAEAFQRALAIDPGFPGAHSSLGIAHYELGQYSEAEEKFERAVRRIGTGFDFEEPEARARRGSHMRYSKRQAQIQRRAPRPHVRPSL